MKVSDIMQKKVDYVDVDTSVREVSRLIFGHRINGVPVCKKRKVVGFITEHDILAKFYPSMSELMDDPVHSQNFEELEERAEEILNLPVSKIMSKNTATITAGTPILKAQSLMQVKKIGRLPVVDASGNLIGLIAKGDIFRAAVGRRMPFGSEENFYDWLSNHYDIFMDWKKRLDNEVPEISKILAGEGVKDIVDIASSSGEHSIALAKAGFKVYGIETSKLISSIAERKKAKLQKRTQENLKFVAGSYKDLIFNLPINIDAALFLGNALPHVLSTNPKILQEVNRSLDEKKATIILQVVNFDKILKKNSGIEEFIVRGSHLAYEKKHAFLGFYTKDSGQKKLIFTQSIFDYDGIRWLFSGINNTNVLRIDKSDIKEMLNKIGFHKIQFFGGSLYEPLFEKPFDPEESDFLNVIARRS